MALRLSLVDNKVARRISVSFILLALIPIGILGYLSYHEVGEQLRDQTAKALHRSCKDYSTRFLDRLGLFENALHLIALKAQKSGNAVRFVNFEGEKSFVTQFVNLTVIKPDGETLSLRSKADLVPELTAQEVKDISSGKTLIKPVYGKQLGHSQLWMAVNLVEGHPESGILIGELDHGTVWDADSLEPNELWVLDETNQLLFASEQDFDLPSFANVRFLQDNSGKFTWENKGDPYVGVYRKHPMKSLYASPALVFILAQPESIAFATIQQFSAIYPPTIALAVLVVAFLITRLIIKYLSPLEQLKAATVKIADGDFNSRVDIESHDEFEELADSFNEMTRRLSSQFNIMSTMAEIDRHILSSLDAEDIIETTLDRLPSILFCDLISIAKVDPGTFDLSDIHTRRINQETKIISGPIALSPRDVKILLEMRDKVIETVPNGKFSAYLQALEAKASWRYLIVPVVVNGTLSSVICLGYQASNTIPPESRSAARNFGDRIAVALSNAAWEEKLYQQAHYDPLTGLPNRLVLNDRLTQELARAKRDGTLLALIVIDLDRFKNVNDSLGHSAGDELLSKVARIFVNCVRATDLVVRLGGDEFVIVISDLHNSQNPMSLLSNIAEKILGALKQTLTVAGHQMTFTASLGIAMFPDDADNIQDLLKNADAAMYHAKNEGRANFRFYSPGLNAAALENIKLEQELRGAIAKNELVVYYQPKVCLEGSIVGAEALIRWQHTELGMISPAKFIPIAEQTGLIVDIGNWVFEQTCLWVNSCRAKGLAPFRVSVNLSAIEFRHPGLVERIAETLTKTGVDRNFIELELTESVAFGNTTTCIEKMNRLKELGITLSMDDFGTGYSSLAYLKDLPLDVLKVDQSFVRHLESDVSSQAIVVAIMALANGLNKEIVSEGVETEAQLTFLKDHQCSIFQGFLFSRPIPAKDFEQLLVDDSLKPKMQLQVLH